MRRDQASGLDRRRRDRATSSARVPSRLAIVSGKGGVGKSALAVNLAVSLGRQALPMRTLLVDGDAGLANADLLMGQLPDRTLAAMLVQGEPTRGAVESVGPGVDLLVSGAGTGVVQALERLAAGHEKVGDQALRIFDLGAGIGSDVVRVAVACETIWLVATPEPTSLADAYATARRIWRLDPNARLELVVNRAPDAAAGVRTHAALERLAWRFGRKPLPLRAVLPEDPAMAHAVARQEPVVLHAPTSPLARRLRLLAESVAEDPRQGVWAAGARVSQGSA